MYDIKHTLTKKIGLISLLLTLVFVFFSLFHSALAAAMPHHAHDNGGNTHSVRTVTNCQELCSLKNNETLQTEVQDEDEKDPSLALAIFISSFAAGFYFYLPDILRIYRKITKIPIYKQTALFRI